MILKALYEAVFTKEEDDLLRRWGPELTDPPKEHPWSTRPMERAFQFSYDIREFRMKASGAETAKEFRRAKEELFWLYDRATAMRDEPHAPPEAEYAKAILSHDIPLLSKWLALRQRLFL